MTAERTAAEGEATLVIAASAADSNLYWATRFLAGDPFIYIEAGGERILLANELELGRARAQARVDRVVSTLPYESKVRETGATAKLTDLAAMFLGEIGAARVTVPASFPLGYAEDLRRRGFVVEVREDPFYPQRAVKTAEEIALIAEAQAAAEEAMALAVGMISESAIEGGLLRRRGAVLTSEDVRREIRRLLLDRGYLAEEVIVAGGEEACDPHLHGSGPLPANRPIVIDIFPRSLETRYWGDMTRTVVRGRAGDAARKLHRDVLDAHDLAVSLIRAGAEGSEVHAKVVELFAGRGNETGEAGGKMRGFIHGTGHGVGLDIHEAPRISRVKSALPAGSVVTVEPGLYYPGIGGVRIEDLVVVEDGGARNLNRFPVDFEV